MMRVASEEDIKPQVNEFEATVEVADVQYVDKMVEVPEIEYIDIPYERVVEIPKVIVQKVEKEVYVPKYVKKPVPNIIPIPTPFHIDRKIPVPVEADVDVRINILKPKYSVKNYEIVVPRFVEVPVPAELVENEEELTAVSDAVRAVSNSKDPVVMNAVEAAALNATNYDVLSRISDDNIAAAVEAAIKSHRLNLNLNTAQIVASLNKIKA